MSLLTFKSTLARGQFQFYQVISRPHRLPDSVGKLVRFGACAASHKLDVLLDGVGLHLEELTHEELPTLADFLVVFLRPVGRHRVLGNIERGRLRVSALNDLCNH